MHRLSIARTAHYTRVAAAGQNAWHGSSAAAATVAHRVFATSSAATPAAVPRTQPPILLFARRDGKGGSAAVEDAAPASCALTSLSHLRSLDPSTRTRLFELTFLGTASAVPTIARNVTSLALRIGRMQRLVVFDCGEGTVRQLARCSHLQLSALSAVFITHLHGDHVFGLCPLLTQVAGTKSRETALPNPLQADTLHKTLHVFGPLGTAAFVKSTLLATSAWIRRPILFHELVKHDTRVADLLPTAEKDIVYHQNQDYRTKSMQMSVNNY